MSNLWWYRVVKSLKVKNRYLIDFLLILPKKCIDIGDLIMRYQNETLIDFFSQLEVKKDSTLFTCFMALAGSDKHLVEIKNY
jgi:hypothetical protein